MTDEEKLRQQQEILKAQQRELLKKLKAIGTDFWGGGAADGATDDGAAEATDGTGDSRREGTDTPKQPAEQAAAGRTPSVQDITGRPEIGIGNLWMTADETVDWTDALAHDRPTDGLTPTALWMFYHEQAEKVLQGDIQAYAEVLWRTNPLGDLTGYADGLTMRAPNPERAEGQFTCRENYLKQYGKKYPAAVGLRIARDLMASLPVSEVGVTAYNEGSLVMEVTYTREALRHSSFRFTDPVELTEKCGGRLEY